MAGGFKDKGVRGIKVDTELRKSTVAEIVAAQAGEVANTLDRVTANLREKLHCISNPESPECTREEPVPSYPPYFSELSQRLYSMEASVKALESLLGRLELP